MQVSHVGQEIGMLPLPYVKHMKLEETTRSLLSPPQIRMPPTAELSQSLVDIIMYEF